MNLVLYRTVAKKKRLLRLCVRVYIHILSEWRQEKVTIIKNERKRGRIERRCNGKSTLDDIA